MPNNENLQPLDELLASKSLESVTFENNPWRILFWNLAQVLHCLPSSFVNDNGHVFQQAQKAIAALKAAPIAQKKPRTTVTVERVRELFTYDPETGKIYHKADRPGGVHAGVEIGYTHVSGQRFLTADRKRLGLHRVAWAIYYGEWPEGMVDHINRDPLDNRIANLRLATYSQNGTNYLRSSKTGYRGVRSLRGKAWQASIKKDGKVTHLGTFQNIEDAARAYNVAAKALHGEFAVLNPIGVDKNDAWRGLASDPASAGDVKGDV